MAAFPSEAERMQRAMVERRTAELGPDHVLTLKGVLKLAQTLKRSTDSELLNEAKVLLQRCINGLEEPEVSKSFEFIRYEQISILHWKSRMFLTLVSMHSYNHFLS